MSFFTLLHPSRGRAKQALKTRDNWLEKATGSYSIEHILSVDEDDSQNTFYRQFFNSNSPTTLVVSNSKNVVEATNTIAKMATGQVLIYLSDDFDCPEGWDQKICDAVYEKAVSLEKVSIGTYKWLLKVDDMLQPFNKDVLTIPIMSKALYNTLGYFWHPAYKSMFVDQHLYYRVKRLGFLYLAPKLKFEHLHYSVGKSERDDTYIRSDANWDYGKALYQKHMKEGFTR